MFTGYETCLMTLLILFFIYLLLNSYFGICQYPNIRVLCMCLTNAILRMFGSLVNKLNNQVL